MLLRHLNVKSRETAQHLTTKRSIMQFDPPLQSATLIRRYKRFLADIENQHGLQTTIHCPNTGAMTGCAEPGFKVWYSTSNNAKRKYPNTWELSQTSDKNWIVINTLRANEIAQEALANGHIAQLAGYADIRREVRYGAEKSRIDFLLSNHARQPDCYIEVKSVTLHEDSVGFFPDAVTARGQKHIRELIAMVAQGYRAVLLFVIGHSAINCVKPAMHIDPVYASLCAQALQAGVEMYAIKTLISTEKLAPGEEVPVLIDPVTP